MICQKMFQSHRVNSTRHHKGRLCNNICLELKIIYTLSQLPEGGFIRGLWPILPAPLCNGLDPLNVPSVEFTTFDICTEYGRKIRSSGAGARKQ